VNTLRAFGSLNNKCHRQASTAPMLYIDHSKGHCLVCGELIYNAPLRPAFTMVVISDDVIQSASTEVPINVRV